MGDRGGIAMGADDVNPYGCPDFVDPFAPCPCLSCARERTVLRVSVRYSSHKCAWPNVMCARDVSSWIQEILDLMLSNSEQF